MQDDKLRAEMIVLAPQILLLTYDHNVDIARTMKEFWTALIDVDEEKQVIEKRWEEIYDLAFKNINN